MTEKTELTNRYSVYGITRIILTNINSNLDSPANRAILSNLRNSISKPISATIGIFSTIYSIIPDEFISDNDRLSFEEKSIITSLQLYALHQQGSNISVISDFEDYKSYANNIGLSLSELRKGDNANAVDKRFNAMITSDTFEELIHHLRQLINLLKSRTNVRVNYAKLAEDLYLYQRGYGESIRLRWARDYYRFNKENENKGEKNEQQ